ncbi:arylformamidase [Salinicoccus roseus]|uniref:Arylformamidase n=1 Tax=Salinicoccus roseus TaxID=45670 RepID=A0A0C2HHN6_9STAP|nr:arylformamidase [Salinicoccus roseus]KIH71169.1 kynurenine formamidase [Salinicoccus roseus]MDB0579893.1 arylformamidase [Salinicoccus roseus]
MMWQDITQTLDDRIAHWPEDTPFSYARTVTKAESGSVNIGKIETSTHIGTHIDAPFHFDDGGATVEALDINRYIGGATVIEVGGGEAITLEDIEPYRIEGTTLLLKTKRRTERTVFPDSIPVLEKRAVEYMASCGIKLFGIDVTSVDAIDSKTLDIHHLLYERDIMILENAVLDEVEPGYYDFVALPLKLQGADGSPVRAALRYRGGFGDE